MTPDSLSKMLSDFLNGARAAVVVKDGAIAFDLAEFEIFGVRRVPQVPVAPVVA
jgi:hypothetical protein